MSTVEQYKDILVQIYKLDVSMVFLNAGVLTIGRFLSLKDCEIEAMVKVNLLHPILLAKAILPQLLNRKQRSAIVFTSSIASTVAMPGLACYAAAKAAISRFAESL